MNSSQTSRLVTSKKGIKSARVDLKNRKRGVRGMGGNKGGGGLGGGRVGGGGG